MNALRLAPVLPPKPRIITEREWFQGALMAEWFKCEGTGVVGYGPSVRRAYMRWQLAYIRDVDAYWMGGHR